MGSLVNGQCITSVEAAVALWCSAGFPKLLPAVGQDAPQTQSCQPGSGSAAVLTVGTVGQETGTCGSWTTSWGGTLDGPDETQFCTFIPTLHSEGAVISNCQSTRYSASWDVTVESGLYSYTALRNGCAAGTGSGTSHTVALQFSPCDDLEAYADSSVVFGLALASLAVIWALKNFVYRLIANQ